MAQVPPLPEPRIALAHALSGVTGQWPAAPGLSAGDWLQVASREGIVSLVERRMRDGLAGVPDPVRQLFSEAVHSEVARLMVRQADARRALARFAEAGLPVLLLKGSALAYWAYPEPHLRSCADVDLLFASREQALAAAGALAADGYTVHQHFGDAATREFMCLSPRPGGRSVELDMHWALSSAPVFADRLAFDELMAQSIALPALAPTARGLGPVHAVLHAAMHRLSDLSNGGGEKLKWLYDLHLLMRGLDDSEWRALVALATAHGLAGVCADALAETARVFGTPVPYEAGDALRLARGREPMDAVKLRGWLYFQGQNLRALPGWSSRARWIWQRLFPTGDYRADVGVSGGALLADRARRALRQLRR